jgi:hypothetical protein
MIISEEKENESPFFNFWSLLGIPWPPIRRLTRERDLAGLFRSRFYCAPQAGNYLQIGERNLTFRLMSLEERVGMKALTSSEVASWKGCVADLG